MSQKVSLTFKIGGTVYVYEGVDTHAARQKDFLDLLVKIKVGASQVLPNFRANFLDTTTSDSELMMLYEEALDKRRKKDAAKKQPAGIDKDVPVSEPLDLPTQPLKDEVKQKQTLKFKGKVFAYDGYPSLKASSTVELLSKQSESDAVSIATFRENVPDSTVSDALIIALVEEKKRLRAAKRGSKVGDEAADQAPAARESALNSQKPEFKTDSTLQTISQPTSQSTAAMSEIQKMSDTEKATINEFIKEVLTAPIVDVAAKVRAPPQEGNGQLAATNDALPASPSIHNLSSSDRVAVYCQENGAPTSKVVYISKTSSFEDLSAAVEKKYGHKMCMSFFEGEDKIEIDDDDVLLMFFEQEGRSEKMRLTVAPFEEKRVTRDDKLTDQSDNAAGAQCTTSVPATGTLSHEEIRTFTGHTAAVYSVAFSPKGNKFCSASRDRSVRIWNTDDGTCKLMKGGHNGLALSCDFSPSGEHIVSSSEDTLIKVWSVATGNKTMSLKGHNDKVYCVQYNSTGAYIVSGSCDKTIRVWNADTGGKLTILKGHSLPVFSCCFSNSDAGKYIASGSDDRLIKIWDWRCEKEVKSLVGHTGTVWSCKFSYSDKTIVSASMDHEINLWCVASGTILKQLLAHMTPIHHAIFTKDDKYVLSCARDWSVIVWDVESGRQIDTINGHHNTVFHMNICGDMLLTSSLDLTVKMWKIKFNS